MWPPSPTVEDEATSLAKEYGLNAIPFELKSEIPPAESRGAVDQYPIILDNVAQVEKNKFHEGDAKVERKEHVTINDSQSSDESSGPATPPRNYSHPRYDTAVPDKSKLASISMSKPRAQSTNAARRDGSMPRGRPQISRIYTEVGNDLRPAVTGQRRAPSPYSYRPTVVSPQVQFRDEKMAASATLAQPANRLEPAEPKSRRARSAHPVQEPRATDNSDLDYRRHRKHRSRSPPDNKRVGHSSSDETRHRDRSRRRKHERSPPSAKQDEASKAHTAVNMTPPVTPHGKWDSPYNSGAEKPDQRRPRHSRHHDRRSSKDSPYTSSAEESHKHRTAEADHGIGSRRNSVNRKEKHYLDLSDYRKPYPGENASNGNDRSAAQHQNGQSYHELLTPTSMRTPVYSDADLQRAIEANRKRTSQHEYKNSGSQSPLISPPTSPPRTPRSERKARDYFELGGHSSHSTYPNHSKSQSRNSSVDEGQHKDLKASISLLSAATMGASLAKVVPSLSRSSTGSGETPSGGLQNKNSGPPRPAKSMPTYEEPKSIGPRDAETRPVEHRPYSNKAPEPRKVSSRPVSRAGSVNGSDEQGFARPHGHVAREERPGSRDGTFGMPPHTIPQEQIRPLQRAHSYSPSTDLPPLSRPGSSHRTHPSTTSPGATPGFHHGLSAGPSPLTRYVKSSPASTDKLASVPAEPSKKVTSLPLCPTPYSVTGVHHWYTVQGLQGFDICAFCMATLGKTIFRDYFVPSPYRPPTEAITCAMNRPWIRIIFMRSLKDGKADLNSIKDLSYLPSSIMPCPGPKSDVRRWYHMVDPTSGNVIPQIDVCTACVRAAETVFTDIRAARIFERPSSKLSQEKFCGLHTGSKYFHALVDELDRLNTFVRNKDLRAGNIQSFIKFIQGTKRYKACTKDSRLLAQAWHYLPELPEFTMCEECYLEVVWPLKDKPIARDIPGAARMVPLLHTGPQAQKSSCQLYSDKMRKIFRDAVSHNDFDSLKKVARLRFDMEHRLHEMQTLYEQDMQAGFDRRADIERIKALWATYE